MVISNVRGVSRLADKVKGFGVLFGDYISFLIYRKFKVGIAQCVTGTLVKEKDFFSSYG